MGQRKGYIFKDEHKAAIESALVGKTKSEEHCKNISEGKKGRKIRGWTEERKAARRAQIAARKSDNSAGLLIN